MVNYRTILQALGKSMIINFVINMELHTLSLVFTGYQLVVTHSRFESYTISNHGKQPHQPLHLPVDV
ncbi:MAG: hypothetical protein SFY80_16055 [Verrucomicrobiota bacterium]|nr:hypothetical protein [Verrucomicrobiota bacterium]